MWRPRTSRGVGRLWFSILRELGRLRCVHGLVVRGDYGLRHLIACMGRPGKGGCWVFGGCLTGVSDTSRLVVFKGRSGTQERLNFWVSRYA